MLSPEKPIKEDKMKENTEETKETQGDQKKVELDSKDSNQEKLDEKSELFDIADASDGSTPGLSKRAQKKLLKRQAWLDSKPERKALEKVKRREKLDKRKAEDPDLPSYSESRKRIKNIYVEKAKSPINIGKKTTINDVLIVSSSMFNLPRSLALWFLSLLIFRDLSCHTYALIVHCIIPNLKKIERLLSL